MIIDKNRAEKGYTPFSGSDEEKILNEQFKKKEEETRLREQFKFLPSPGLNKMREIARNTTETPLNKVLKWIVVAASVIAAECSILTLFK